MQFLEQLERSLREDGAAILLDNAAGVVWEVPEDLAYEIDERLSGLQQHVVHCGRRLLVWHLTDGLDEEDMPTPEDASACLQMVCPSARMSD